MGLLFLVLGAILIIVGVFQLLAGALLWAIVLIVIGLILAAAGGGGGRW